MAYFLLRESEQANPGEASRHPHLLARAVAGQVIVGGPGPNAPSGKPIPPQFNHVGKPQSFSSPSPSYYANTGKHYHHSHHQFNSPFLATSIKSLASVPSTLVSQIRLLSTSISLPTPPTTHIQALQSGLPFLLPLTTILKSTAALNIITTVSRLALTLLPLSVRAKIIHALRERYIANPSSFSPDSWVRRLVERGGTESGWGMRLNAKFLLPLLVSLPFVLLGGIILASFERTPITGRRRIVMLSPSEEAELVSSILHVADSAPSSPSLSGPPAFVTSTQSRDWPTILQTVLSLPDEGISPITGRRILLGGEVLDERDWRVRWTEAVLRALEAGVPALSVASPSTAGTEGILHPPPTKFPLTARPNSAAVTTGSGFVDGAGGVVAEYDLLVIDRKESNAFSFGFGPDQVGNLSGEGRRGVIVVYSGFLDEILAQPHVLASSLVHPAPPASTGFFSRKPAPPQQPDLTTVPEILPTPLQTKSLAVLLSHELAHLVLSHTLESYASTSLLIPQLSKLGSDVLRTLIYPITALLGPFLNDSIGASLNVGAQGGFGILGRVVNSCGSRQLEGEADVVALRMLAHSGIDPHHALNFWEDRLAAPTPAQAVPAPPESSSSHLLRLHSPQVKEHNHDEACGFLRTHPVNEERVERLRTELREWERYEALV